MASIDKLPSGKYRVRFSVDGRRATRTFPSKASAREFVKAAESGDGPSPSSTIRLDAWVGQWFPSHVATVKPSTSWAYKRSFNLYVLPRLGHFTLEELTPRRLRDWQAGLVRDGYSHSTVKVARTALGMSLSAATVDELIVANPLDRVNVIPVRQKEVRILNEAELHALAEAIDPRWRALVLIGGYCGLRPGEAYALRVKDVDLERGVVHVRLTVTLDAEGGLGVGPAKTENSVRSIAMPRQLAEEVQLHIDAGYSNDINLFTSPRGAQLRPENFRNRYWAKAIAKASLLGLRPHDLRHTAVSMWIRSGASPKLVAQRAGHASAAFVINVYGHLFDSEDADLAVKLEDRWVTREAELGLDVGPAVLL